MSTTIIDRPEPSVKPTNVMAIVMSSLLAATPAACSETHSPTIIGVPAYGYPPANRMWVGLAHRTERTVVVVNPASGPGTSVDPVYTRAIARVSRASTEVYGYVDTNYGKRPTDEILADVDRYAQWYQPDGIFLDQTPTGASALAYLRTISTRLRARGLLVALNPGQPVMDPSLTEMADHVVNFEGSLDQYQRVRFPSWTKRIAPNHFWHLVYGVEDAETMSAVVARAGEQGAGMVFVTDGTMPNPWTHLPTYWKNEADLVHDA